MVNNRAAVAAMLILLTLAAPVAGHDKKHHQPAKPAASAEAPAGQGVGAAAAPVSTVTPSGIDEGMMPMQHDTDDRATMTLSERLLDWVGRLHVSVVHFPLAFFPAALFTALVGRRRSGFAKPVQFLIVAGGVTAPLAAVLGWLDSGMVSAADPLLMVHRWLGTAIGVSGAGLALWAWRRPEADRSAGMIAALALITAALLVQGWYGGAMVHGIGHMNW